ncbi:MAG: glutathione synthase [Alphaproteobacteria bacterium]
MAVQADAIAGLNPETDTSLFLAREALAFGFRVFAYTPQNLSFSQGQIMARGSWLDLNPADPSFHQLSDPEYLSLAEAAVVLIRQDPPYDMAYLTTTYLLEHLPDTTRVINSPRGIREAPEKLLVTHFPHLMPPSLISWDETLIEGFIAAHGRAVLKPLYSFGGQDVILIDHTNWRKELAQFRDHYREPPMIQLFLPEVREGDRRVLLIDGEPVGVVLRIPQPGDIRSNTCLGGRAESCPLRDRDVEICREIAPRLRALGLFLVGIDIIGNYLTEINVTSPTSFMLYHRLTGENLARRFWETLLKS